MKVKILKNKIVWKYAIVCWVTAHVLSSNIAYYDLPLAS